MDSTETASIAERLADVSIFREFSKDELNRLATFGHIQIIQPQAHAVIEGDPSRGLFIVLKGSVSVYKSNIENGDLSRIGQLEEGSCFGEMSLFDSAPRSATVVADKVCDVFVLDSESFERFIQQKGSALQLKFYKSCALDLATRFRQLNQDYMASQNLLWKKAFSK